MIQTLKKLKWLISIVIIFNMNLEARNYYGAIAYSPSTGDYGYSYDYSSRYSAEQNAISRCGAYDCSSLIWFRNACGALAVGNNGYGSGWGDTKYRAKREALKSCRRYSSGCSVRQWVCTTR